MRQPVVALGCMVALCSGALREVGAQGRPIAVTVGGALGLTKPDVSFETPGTAGGGVGVEMGRDVVRLRLTANHAKSFRGGDDVSICALREDYPGVCYQSAYRRVYVIHASDVLLQPSYLGPFYAVGGGGLALMHGHVREHFDPLPDRRYLWRAGGGVTLGSSHRAPRLEVVRTAFAGSVGAARHLLLAQLWLR